MSGCPPPLPLHAPFLLFIVLFLHLLILSRAVVPLPSRATGRGGEIRSRPLVSEVRPLMEQNQSQNRRVSRNQDQTQKQNMDQMEKVESKSRTNQDQTQPPQLQNQVQQGLLQFQVEEDGLMPKKKVQSGLDSRRNLGTSGLRKAQSVQSLLSDRGTNHTVYTADTLMSGSDWTFE